MIIVWGSPADPPVGAVLDALSARSATFELLDDRSLGSLHYDLAVGANPAGVLRIGARRIEVTDITGVYLRPGPQPRAASNQAGAALLSVFQSHAARIVNRPSAGHSNHTKPFQLAAIAAAGIAVPDTLLTSDRQRALAFLRQHRRIVYKSISGIRSIVSAIEDDGAGEARLEGLGHGPVQLQRLIRGTDVRVHVVGDRWFSTAIDCEATDYRFAGSDGSPPSLRPCELPSWLAAKLVELTRAMGLLVSGIDLRCTARGEWYCFEVNPSPGFTYYEAHTGQPIARAIAELLATPTCEPIRQLAR